MAPFRKFSRGYTGQVKNAYREFEFDPIILESFSAKVDELINSDFGEDDAYKFTQFIRGKLFFYIDSLLTLQKGADKKAFPNIVKFMRKVFELILKWMKLFPKYASYVSVLYYLLV